jgi:tetratricopeptide (TPR) repeat protein
VYGVIANSYPGTDHEIRALVEMAYTYLFYKNDLTKAREISDGLDKIAKDNISVKFLKGKVYEDLICSNLTAAEQIFNTAMNLVGIATFEGNINNFVEALRLIKLIIENPEIRSCDTNKQFYLFALGSMSLFLQEAKRAEEAGEESELENWRDIFEYIKARTKDDLDATFDQRYIWATTLSKIGYWYETIAEYEELFKIATTDRERERVLFDLLMIYKYLSDNGKIEETSERIEKLKSGNGVTYIENLTDLPTEYTLSQNYPNPFNPTTVIKYQLPEAAQVSLVIYDIMGKEIATLVNSYQARGSYDVTFNANSLSSGIYLYKLNANGKQLINKMLLMK